MTRMKVKRPTEIEISDRTWRGQQSWNRERIMQTASGTRLRFYIHCDAYDFQSYGKVELWDGTKWHQIHHIPGQRLDTKVSYVQRDVQPTAFNADMLELRRVAFAVIGVRP